MPKLTILDDYQQVALSSADWSTVGERYEIDVVGDHLDGSDLIDRLHTSEVVVAMRERTPFSRETLSLLPDLKLLVTTGLKNAAIDLDAARELGITVSGTNGSGNAMPELTIGIMIALMRNFAQEDAAIRAGGWQHTIGPGLSGHTLGIVGLGRLGGPVAELAQAFAMDVIAWSEHLTPERAAEHGARAVSKAELFTESDVISIHLPLSERSRGLIGAQDLALMKPTAYLINTSRGPIVEEAALIEALTDRRIAGAGLDVYDLEPLPVDHPLRSLRNTLLLPHIGYVTTDAYRTFYADAVSDVLAFADGKPVRVL